MNVLYEAKRLRHSSTTSVHTATSVEQVQRERSSSKEQLLVEQQPKHAKRVTFSKHRKLQQQTTIKDSEMQTGLTSCLITNPSIVPRVTGGANNPAERKVGWLARTDSECQFKAPGIDFLTNRETDVHTFEVKMRESVQSVKDYTTKCDYFPTYVDKRRFKDQTTQTLYRESSAQTLAYLPDITDKEQAEHLELFNLSSLLPGDKPPGLHEVEILERARKRWAFNKALKTSFKRQLHEAREMAIKSKYRPILEAFEWEHWMEREEYIQECQMMRLEIVIRMFDKREKQMHIDSKTRIEVACEGIEQKRQHGLAKNEVEYQRAMRRLQIKNAGISRRWVKQSPMYALGSPCSEFYGPLIRHGVDPARRSFVGDGRKAFDMRIDDLEKRVNMDKLQCPFTKLKEWSKPKEYVKEYEQNFCSDKHLQKLYESLKSLRSQATKQKTAPKCLKRRPKPVSEEDRMSFNYHEVYNIQNYFQDRRKTTLVRAKEKPSVTEEQKLAINRHIETDEGYQYGPELAKELMRERRHEDLEQLLHMYEGSTIGWIMQFLSEEMERLKEQRKLHFFSILTQKERWRREAAEAGLRQKENDMRLIYEDIFQQSNVVHTETAENYIDTILTTDMAHIAERSATETVTLMAKEIDKDIERWLDKIKLIQTPLTYESLRIMLRDMFFPELSSLLFKHESDLIVKYIIEDVLFAGMWEELETYDIASTIASDLIDRLIDNDLYLFSTESESDEPHRSSWYEAEAIIRKLIRQAVPGRRWKTETERIVHENCTSLMDDIFTLIMEKMDEEPKVMQPVYLHRSPSHAELSPTDNIRQADQEIMDSALREAIHDEDAVVMTTHLRTQILTLIKKFKKDNVTKALITDEEFKEFEPRNTAFDSLLNTTVYEEANSKEQAQEQNDFIYSIMSSMNIGNDEDFTLMRSHPQNDEPKRKSSSISSIGINFGQRERQARKEEQLIGELNNIIAYNKDELKSSTEEVENTEYEADDERSWWNMASGEEEEIKDVEDDDSTVQDNIVKYDKIPKVKDDLVTDDIVKDDIVQDDIVKEDIVNDDIVKDDIFKDDIVQDDIVKDDIVNDDIVKDDIVKDDIVKDDIVKDDIVKVGIVKDGEKQQDYVVKAEYDTDNDEAQGSLGRKLSELSDDFDSRLEAKAQSMSTFNAKLGDLAHSGVRSDYELEVSIEVDNDNVSQVGIPLEKQASNMQATRE